MGEPDANLGDQEADVGHMQSLQAGTGGDAAPAHRPVTAAAGTSLALAEQQAVKDHLLAREEWIEPPALGQQGSDTPRDEEIWERLELDTVTQVPPDHCGTPAAGDDTSRVSEQSQPLHWEANQPTPSSSSEETSSDRDQRRKRKRKQREKQPKKKKKKKKKRRRRPRHQRKRHKQNETGTLKSKREGRKKSGSGKPVRTVRRQTWRCG